MKSWPNQMASLPKQNRNRFISPSDFTHMILQYIPVKSRLVLLNIVK
jgi:hypothetical protein